MEFKIDTKATYTIITPVANEIDANLTGALRQKRTELRQSGSINYITDLHNCLKLHDAALQDLINLHGDCYADGESLVFTHLTDDVMRHLKQHDTYATLNIAPTMEEAVDIVNMEILERELFSEE